MAKICEKCNHPIPPGHSVCPHCVATLAPDEPLVTDAEDFHVMEAEDKGTAPSGPKDQSRHPDSTEVVNLEIYKPGEPASGASNVAWAAFDEPEDVDDQAAPAQFDSPSDVDLRRFLSDEELALHNASTKLPGDLPHIEPHVPPEDEGAGAVQNTRTLLPDDLPHIETPPPPGKSPVEDLSTVVEPQMSLEDEASAVNLGARGRHTDPAISDLHLIHDALEVDSSAVDLGRSSAHDLDAAELLETGSAVNLGDKPAGTGERPSSRDLIAEAVESGVDLPALGAEEVVDAEQMPARHDRAAQAEEEIFEAEMVADDESSAVDLGSSEVVEIPSSVVVTAAGSDSSAVDLGSSAVVELPASGKVVEAEEVIDMDVGPGEEGGAPLEMTTIDMSALREEGTVPVEELGEVANVVDIVDDEEDATIMESGGFPAPAGADSPPPRHRKALPTQLAMEGFEEEMAADAAGANALRHDHTDQGAGDDVIGDMIVDEVDETPVRPSKPGKKARVAGAEDDGGGVATAEKPRSSRLLFGMVLGVLLASLGLIGAWFAGLEPPIAWREALTGKTAPASPSGSTTPADAKAREDSRALAAVAEKLKQNQIDNPDVSSAVDQLLQTRTTQAALLSQVRLRLDRANIKEPDVGKAMDQLLASRQPGGDPASTAKLAALAARLRQEMFLDPDVTKALDQLIQAKKSEDDRLAAIAAKLKAAKIAERDPAKGVDQLLLTQQAAEKGKKNAEEGLAAATSKLQLAQAGLRDATTRLSAADASLTAVGAQLKAAGVADPDPIKGVTRLAEQRTRAQEGVSGALKKLETAKLVPPGADTATLLKALDEVVALAQMKDPEGHVRTTEARNRQLQTALSQRHSPQEMLDYWQPLLQERGAKEVAGKALQDARRVAAAANSTPSQKAQALSVEGLALRNDGKFTEARAKLEAALKQPGVPPSAKWRAGAEKALKEISDPRAYYLPRIDELTTQGKYPEALELLTQAQDIFPDDKATVLAQRSQVRLELALDKAKEQKLAESDPAVAGIRKDALDAVSAGAGAEGHYALGRLDEALGKLTAAAAEYRKAMQLYPAEDEVGNRYRLATARVLWKLHLQKPNPRSSGVGRAPSLSPTEVAAYLIVLLVQAGADDGPLPPGATSELQEANELAKRILASKSTANDFMVRSQALAIQGEWTKALTVYVEGLRPHLRRDYADGLMELVKNHPAFKMPDSLNLPSPQEAEVHFSAGLSHYWARDFADAEKEFLTAIKYEKQDARYFYFLGLARLQQGRRDRGDAQYNFEQAAKLERLERPSRAAVNAALERIQGPMRQELNRFRP